jgi:hypothetical protein
LILVFDEKKLLLETAEDSLLQNNTNKIRRTKEGVRGLYKEFLRDQTKRR